MPTLINAYTMVVKWSPDLLNVHPQRKGTAPLTDVWVVSY